MNKTFKAEINGSQVLFTAMERINYNGHASIVWQLSEFKDDATFQRGQVIAPKSFSEEQIAERASGLGGE